MSKALIIAEKPSVAGDIAKAIGGFTKHDEYYESDRYVLSSAVGHLLEIGAPEEYEVKRGKWSFAHLPVIPPHFDLKPMSKNESRLKMLIRLIKRKDINLLINACQAIEGRGTVTLRTQRDGDRVRIQVTDTGRGIRPADLGRIFEPFFTTKPVGTGTGLGLSVAYSIVKHHGGTIEVASEPGAGCRFTVCLRRVEAPAEQDVEAAA
jgi:signal transduction histidine kinase